jgi:hypothetical protein
VLEGDSEVFFCEQRKDMQSGKKSRATTGKTGAFPSILAWMSKTQGQ